MGRKYFGTDGIRGKTNAGVMTAAGPGSAARPDEAYDAAKFAVGLRADHAVALQALQHQLGTTPDLALRGGGEVRPAAAGVVQGDAVPEGGQVEGLGARGRPDRLVALAGEQRRLPADQGSVRLDEIEVPGRYVIREVGSGAGEPRIFAVNVTDEVSVAAGIGAAMALGACTSTTWIVRDGAEIHRSKLNFADAERRLSTAVTAVSPRVNARDIAAH